MPETFTPFTWADGSGGGTPITATQLNRLEAGVESMDDRITALEAGGGSSTGALFSADTTGATDVSAALVSQATAAANAGVALIVPPGNYLLTAAATLPNDLTVWAPSGARFFGAIGASSIVVIGTRVTLRGLTIENTTRPTGWCVGIDTNAKNPTVEDCTLIGGDVGVYCNASGVENLQIRGNRIKDMWWGILTNSGANDLKGCVVENNHFTVIRGDAIEFNHPSASAAAVRGIRVADNYIEGMDDPIGTTNTGFGVGVAGCADVTITGNTIVAMRREGIHIEDGSNGVTITGNTIRDIPVAASGTNRAGIAVYGATTDDLTITGNAVLNVAGVGIELVYAGGADLVSTVAITDNIVRNATTYGITCGADYGVGEAWNVSDNIVRDCGSGGIGFFGSFRYAMATNNTVTNCPIGIQAGQKDQLRILRGNLIRDCTVDYDSNFRPLVLTERHASVELTAVGATLAAPLFRLGSLAEGVVALSFTDFGSRNIVALWRVRWDGSVLSCSRESGYGAGGASDSSLSMVNGVLTVNLTGLGADVQCWGWAHFNGTLTEDMATYSGTVAGRAFAGSVVGLTQTAYDALTPVPGVLYVITGA